MYIRAGFRPLLSQVYLSGCLKDMILQDSHGPNDWETGFSCITGPESSPSSGMDSLHMRDLFRLLS